MRQEARLRGQAEAVVAGALESNAPALRAQAARIAAEMADPLLDRGLAARLGDPDAGVRATAAAALARATPLAADVLRHALDGDDAAARVIALDAIDTLPDAAARLARLAGDGDVRVRARVATALVQAKHPAARALLEKLLGDGDAGVRGQALAGLAALGDRGALGVVAQALDDPSLGVRLAALGRGEVGDRLLALATPATPGRDRFVALRAAVQLSRAGRGAAALPSVRAAAEDRDAAVRAAAMNAAGELGGDGVALARAHLRDPDLDVRLAAARATIAAGERDAALPVLVSALGTPRRLDAADELARLGDPRGVAALRAAAHSADADERRLGVLLLAPLPAGHDTLVAALGDGDARVRLDAAGALLRHLFREPPR